MLGISQRMPAALEVDWEAIRKDYVERRMTCTQLQDKYGVKLGTIDARAKRHGWKPAADVARQAAQHAAKHAVQAHIATALAQVKPELDSAVREWTNRSTATAKKIIEHVSNTLDNQCPPPEELQKLAGALDRADSIGRRGYGLDKQDPGQAVRVNISLGVLGGISPDGKPVSVTADGLLMDYASDAPVVDVESQDVSEPLN